MNILIDTFTAANGTNLAAHTADDGSTWSAHPASTLSGVAAIAVAGGNGSLCPLTQNATAVYLNSQVPQSADYSVSAPLILLSTQTGDQAGVVGRFSATEDKGYLALYIAGTGASYALVVRIGGGNARVLGTYTPPAFAADDMVTLAMTETSIQLLVNGIARVTATDATWASAGQAGVELSTSNPPAALGLQIDSVNADVSTANVAAKTAKYVGFDGDSLTWSSYASSGRGSTFGNGYPGKVLAGLGAGWSADNFGVPGQTVAQMAAGAARVDATYVAGRTDVLVMEGLTNDLVAYQQQGLSAAAQLAALQAVWIAYWQARRSASPGRRLVGTTISPVSPTSSVIPSPAAFNAVAAQFNAWAVASYATYIDGLWVIASDARLADATNATYYQPDGVHRTDAGYAAFASGVLAAVAAATATLATPSTLSVSPATIPAGTQSQVTVTGTGLSGQWAYGGTAGATVVPFGPFYRPASGQQSQQFFVSGNATGTVTFADAVNSAAPTVTVTLAAAEPAPPQVTPASGSAVVTWAASAGASTYRVYLNGAATTNVSSGSPLTTTLNGLANGTAYAVGLSAVDAAGHESAVAGPVPVTPRILPLAGGFDATPSDAADQPYYGRTLTVGVAGVVRVTLLGSTVTELVPVAAGVPQTLAIARLWATGTTAAGPFYIA